MDAGAAWAFLLGGPPAPTLPPARSARGDGWASGRHQPQPPPLLLTSPRGPAAARHAAAAAVGWSADGWTPKRPVPWRSDVPEGYRPAPPHPPQQQVDAAGWVRKYSEEHRRPYWVNVETQESTWYDPRAQHAPRGTTEEVAEPEKPWWWPQGLPQEPASVSATAQHQHQLRQQAPSERAASWLASWGDAPPREQSAAAAPMTTVKQLAAGTRDRPVPPPVIVDEASRHAAMAAAQSPFKMLSASLRRVEPPPELPLQPEPELEPQAPSVQYALFSRCVQTASDMNMSDPKDTSHTIQTSQGPVTLTVPANGGKTKGGDPLTREEIYSTAGLKEAEGSFSDAGSDELKAIKQSALGIAQRSTAPSAPTLLGESFTVRLKIAPPDSNSEAVGTTDPAQRRYAKILRNFEAGVVPGADLADATVCSAGLAPDAAVATRGPILELWPQGATFAAPVQVTFSLADLLRHVESIDGDAVLCVLRTDGLADDGGWKPLGENEQLTVTEHGEARIELYEYSFARYLMVWCITGGTQVGERAATVVSDIFTAAQQALKAGSKVRLGGWEGIDPERSGYLVHGTAAVTLACSSSGEGGGSRTITVAENADLTRNVANGVTARLCRASRQRLEAELAQLQGLTELQKRARAVGMLEPDITKQVSTTALAELIVDKCWAAAPEAADYNPTVSLGSEGTCTADEEEAAVKMQAIQRGKLARKEVEGMKIEMGLGLEGTEEEAQAIAKLQAVQRGKNARKEVEGMKIEKGLGLEGTEEEAQAIAKLQAVQRGKNARKEVEGMKIE
eukprot:COSAG06_NODE_3752_length_4945_cov_5.541478_1_plen_791_part_10